MSDLDYLKTWLAAVMAATYLKDRAKVTGYGLSTFADWTTGRDCYPSDVALAARIGVTPRTARRGRLDLEAAGFIARTGVGRLRNTTDYALVIPASTDKVVPSESGASTDKVVPTDQSSTDKVVPTELRQYGHLRQSVRTPEAVSTDKVVLQPPHTSSRPLGSEEDDESAYAPPPDGGAHALEETQAAVMAALRQRWQDQTPVMSNRTRSLLTDLLSRGWTSDQIAAGVATISASPKNPAMLLEAHLKRLRDDHQPGDFEYTTSTTTATITTTATAEDRMRIFTAMDSVFTAAQGQGWTLTGHRPDDDNERAMDLHGHGCTITVYVDADSGIPATNEVSVSLTRPVSPERLGTLQTIAHDGYVYGEQGDPRPRYAEVLAPTVADVPATIQRVMATFAQTPPAPAKATGSAKPTPTPRAVAEVLADDHRRPGADGFAHFDPPGRITPQPPGHDQAVRQADDLERKRQQRALADIDDPAILEALAALQANGIPTDPQQENTP